MFAPATLIRATVLFSGPFYFSRGYNVFDVKIILIHFKQIALIGCRPGRLRYWPFLICLYQVRAS